MSTRLNFLSNEDNIKKAEELKIEIKQNSNRSIRKKCTTLLKAFGYKKKTTTAEELITEILDNKGIKVEPSLKECDDSQQFLKLTFTKNVIDNSPSPPPVHIDNELLSQLSQKELHSEKSVEIRFIVPLLELLGYTEDDRVDYYRINYQWGSQPKKIIADFALFDGLNRAHSNILLVVEAKSVNTNLDDKRKNARAQAQSYAYAVKAPFFVVTNGIEIRVYKMESTDNCYEIVRCNRANLCKTFDEIYRYISKEAIITHKKQNI